ncbi:MAG: pilin [Patescibacteria group bacterium]
MTGKFKALIASLLVVTGLLVPLVAPTVVLADIQSKLCGSAQDLSVNSTKDCTTTGASEDRFQEILANIINIFSLIVGVVAVIMIIFGGFKYITSAGNQESVKTAKQTLIYALIGLIIVALAQIIVKFVLNTATNYTSSSPSASQGECQRTRSGAFWIGGPNPGEPC